MHYLANAAQILIEFFFSIAGAWFSGSMSTSFVDASPRLTVNGTA